MSAQSTSYREQIVNILPGATHTVQFSDTQPNHYYINNLSTSDVYLGVTKLPTPTKYDLYVGPSEQRVTGRDKGVQQIYLYNDSTNPATIELTTFAKPFDPTVLIGVGQQSGSASRPSSNVITGFTAPLPQGFNHIGSVKVDELPSLPEGNKTIGKVIIPEPVTIGSMPPIEVTNDPVRGYHHMYDGNVDNQIVTVDFSPRTVTKFSYITNDDPVNDLFITFNDDTVTNTSGLGYNGVIRLKGGESISDLGRMASKINFVRNTGNGNVRMLGV